jgi:hypothetical protein
MKRYLGILLIFLLFCSILYGLSSRILSVRGEREHHFAFQANEAFFHISAFNKGVLWCGRTKLDSPFPTGLFLYSFKDESIREVVRVGPGWMLMPAIGRGDWLAWLEYKDVAPPLPWILKAMRMNSDEIFTIAKGHSSPHTLPIFTLDNDRIAFSQPLNSERTTPSRIVIIDLPSRQQICLIESAKWSYSMPTMSGNFLVCCRAPAQSVHGEKSNLYLWRFDSKTGMVLMHEGNAYQPSLAGSQLSWKRSGNRFTYGDIMLASLENGQLMNIYALGTSGDMPSVSHRFVTWRRDGCDSVIAYTMSGLQTLDSGIVGKADTGEDIIAWGSMDQAGENFEIRGIKVKDNNSNFLSVLLTWSFLKFYQEISCCELC